MAKKKKDQISPKADGDKNKEKGSAGKMAAAPEAKPDSTKGKKKTGAPAKTKAEPKPATSAPKKAAGKKSAPGRKTDNPNAGKSPSPAKAAKPVSTHDLLFRRFEGWPPGKLYTPKKIKRIVPPPPPLVETDDPKVAAQIRQLLFKRFDLSAPTPRKTDAAAAGIPMTPAPKPSTATTVPPVAEATPPREKDPADRMIKIGVLVLAVLILIVAGASRLNMQKYYLDETDGALEIRKGTFSPSGRELMMILPGVPMPEETKPVYKEEDVFPLIYQFYLDKADALLTVPGIPDLEGAEGYLNQSLSYGNPPTGARERLNRIDAMILTLKADTAAARGSITDLQEAARLLKKASLIKLNETEATVIKEKIAAVDTALAAMKISEKVPESPADALEAE